jgi:hypothetical protein
VDELMVLKGTCGTWLLDCFQDNEELFAPRLPIDDLPSSGEGAPQFGHGASLSGRAVLQLVQNMFFAYLTWVFACLPTN